MDNCPCHPHSYSEMTETDFEAYMEAHIDKKRGKTKRSKSSAPAFKSYMDIYDDQKPPKLGKMSPAECRRLKPYSGIPDDKPYKCSECSYATTDHGRLLAHSLYRCTRNPKKPRKQLTLSKTHNSDKLLVPLSLLPGVRRRAANGSRIFNCVNTSTNSPSSRTESEEGKRHDLESRSVSKATSQLSINESVLETKDVVLSSLTQQASPNCSLQIGNTKRRLRIAGRKPEKETSQVEKEAEKVLDMNAPIKAECDDDYYCDEYY
ncbi:hypothetical protein DdX_10039 [Ditylenchus destructor]|uniref:C2H2-type domain-containing protein n=1 Tax=Ditylenchus destructor TaxID=166010 RepID=A0AAD4N2J8_9BILA|nr:hypothetical protein DdX_10039 [Ditylenchus destructor]